MSDWGAYVVFLIGEALLFGAMMFVLRYNGRENLRDKMTRLKESGQMDVRWP